MRYYKYLLFIVLIVSFTPHASAQTGNTERFGLIELKHSPEVYDSLLLQLNKRLQKESYDQYVREFIDIDLGSVDLSNTLPDHVYEERLKMMATEIQLPYNDVVKRYIAVYTRPGLMEGILGKAQYFFPIVEEALYKYNLPMELKMLPVIESALIPKAQSSASAMGLWQFMLRTGRYYGLEVNSYIDERCDPVKATDAACRYLRDMYKMYGDWTLVIAAYNCGPGNVNKALKRVPNAKTYWDIYNYLPRETRGYVPGFIAASYAYTYHKAHGMKPYSTDYPLATDTMMINKLMHFEQVSSTIGLPVEIIRSLNPQYRIDIIPAKDRPYPLVLPQNAISAFIENELEIYGKDSLYLEKYLNISNLNDDATVSQTATSRQTSTKQSSGTTQGSKVSYKVKRGDTLGAIASKYRVTVKDLMRWNKLKSTTSLQIGKTLIIYRK